MGESIVVEDISFPCEGITLLGRLYRPNDESVYPAVAICHGFPGDTKNMDLAEELALVITVYTYSAQVTNASYQPSEYLKEPPVTTTGQTGSLFDWIKGLSYLGLITTIGLLLFR